MIFRDKYDFLSNFYACSVVIDVYNEDNSKCKTLAFKNSEAAFQSLKNYDLADKFCLLNPSESKYYGKRIPLTTPNWNQVRIVMMARVLYAKFSQNPHLLTKLKEVKEEIVEDNYWKDYFWGVCNGKGSNMLGKLLMCVRDTNNNYEDLMKYAVELTLENSK